MITGTAAVDKAFGSEPQTLAASSSIVVDARGVTLTVITITGGTGNVSRVDSTGATGDAGAGSNTALTAATLAQFKDWGYYRITATGQALRWMLV